MLIGSGTLTERLQEARQPLLPLRAIDFPDSLKASFEEVKEDLGKTLNEEEQIKLTHKLLALYHDASRLG